ncbi:MAG: hypothetical protein QNJ68_03235 [Microcoleaceae cyanobacterium MO_207.B10]|nr:hypothetical protein [Microcoleaceae cyanobacterium MO_207.B10]
MMRKNIHSLNTNYNQAQIPEAGKTAQKRYYPRSKKIPNMGVPASRNDQDRRGGSRTRRDKHQSQQNYLKPAAQRPKISRITSPSKSTRRQRQLSTSHKLSLQLVSLPWRKWMMEWAGITLLFGGSSLMAVGAWLSVKLISDPNAIVSFNELLPNWTQFYISGNKSLQSLDQIKYSLTEEGLAAGEIFELPSTREDAGSDVLVPVMKQIDSRASLPCETPCREVVELRVYQSVLSVNQREGSKPYFRLVNTLPLKGPAESFVIASTIESASAPQGSNQPLPVTTVRRFQGKVPAAGVWFSVSGQRVQNNKTIPYGRVVNYNPNKNYLSSMLEWKSTAGQAPIWQEMTGAGDPELVVEQTVGLDPDFDIYQIQPRNFILNPIELERISLDENAIGDRYYKDALRLARSGLWSPALALLQPLQESIVGEGEQESEWRERVQAQFDLIEFHAKITEAQAIASWASPSQKVLAGLIDGRWQESLKVFEDNISSTYEITKMLQNDSGRLSDRVNVALRVNRNDSDAKAWGALILASQKGRRRAESWLRRQPDTKEETKERIGKLLDRLDAAVARE